MKTCSGSAWSTGLNLMYCNIKPVNKPFQVILSIKKSEAFRLLMTIIIKHLQPLLDI